MTSDEMSEEVALFLEEANELQWRKNKDYHPEGVAFLEILRTASECGITVEQDLWAKIRKQYVALRSFVINGGTESESPRSRMIDIAVYMGMLAFWEAFKDQIILDAFRFMQSNTKCETSVNSRSCFTELKTHEEKCDRCRFVTWLMAQGIRINVNLC